MAIETYRNLVIGSGEAGKILAWNLARAGEKSAVVERSMIGGSCPNVACLPSKNVVYSAKAVSLVDPKHGLGVVTGSVKVDMAGVVRRKRAMVDGLVAMHLDLFKQSGAELVMGEARFTGPKTVRVTGSGTDRELAGERVILCLGSRAAIPDVPGLAISGPMTHVEALNLERLPEHLVVLGGGYVGLEFAQALRRFGSRVTIVQHGPRLLDHEDAEFSAAILELMRDEGIDVLLQAELKLVTGHSGNAVRLQVTTPTGERTIDASDILVAAGRTPNTDRLDLAKTGVELDGRGFVRVDERLRTSAPGIWAVGDCAGSPMFTHVGYDDFRVVLADIKGGDRTTRDRLIPYCLFTDPELAHVGMHESEVRAKKIPYRVSKLPMAAVLRTRTLSQTRGFMKALIGADERILGFTCFGAEASELMAVVQTAMVAGMPYTALGGMIFTHPTAAEGLVGLFSKPPMAPDPA
jgi:pyruvate/2-oxoglutarate dehydrogenase complex dihydrolipoamide dehydrogenase (E3) component